jgi:Flp pilus assembly protein TadB
LLWTDPRGLNLLITGGVMMLLGFYVMYQMINFEV